MKVVGVLVVGLIVAYSSRESSGLASNSLLDDKEATGYTRKRRAAIVVLHRPTDGEEEAQPREFPGKTGMQSSAASEPSPAASGVIGKFLDMLRSHAGRFMPSYYGQQQQPKAEEETPRIRIRVIASNPQQQMGIGQQSPSPSPRQLGFRRVITNEQQPLTTQTVQGGSNDDDSGSDGLIGRIVKVTRTQIHRIKMYFTPSSSNQESPPPLTSTHTYKTVKYTHPDGTTTTTTTTTQHGGAGDQDGNGAGRSPQQGPTIFHRIYKTMRSAFPF